MCTPIWFSYTHTQHTHTFFSDYFSLCYLQDIEYGSLWIPHLNKTKIFCFIWSLVGVRSEEGDQWDLFLHNRQMKLLRSLPKAAWSKEKDHEDILHHLPLQLYKSDIPHPIISCSLEGLQKKKKITLGRAAENSWNPDRTQTLVLKYYQWISMQSVLSNNNFVHSIYTSIHVYVCVYTHKYPCKLSNVIR